MLAFLAARYLLGDAVQSRFGKQFAPVNEGMRSDGVFYLLTLRLVPLFPFFLVNLLAGLTPIGAARFYWVSQLGMLAGTVVYVNAGTQLAAIQRPADVLSPGLLASFVLLGVFPLIAKALVEALKRRQVYAGWARPRRFDRNLVVIGAGAGGLVTAYIGAAVKAKVTLVEGHKMGGDCLNFGCVPSKALIRSAKLARQIDKAGSLGIRDASGRVDFAAVMARVQRVVGDIAPHDSVERYRALGVDVVQGHARISSPWRVEITGADGQRQTLTTKNIVIATGARPFVPPIPGLVDRINDTGAFVFVLFDACHSAKLVRGALPGTDASQLRVRHVPPGSAWLAGGDAGRGLARLGAEARCGNPPGLRARPARSSGVFLRRAECRAGGVAGAAGWR